MQQRAAMRFVGGSLAPLSQQSAVSRLRCWAAEVHHPNGTARCTPGEAASTGLRDRRPECGRTSQSRYTGKPKREAGRRDSRRTTRHLYLNVKSSHSEECWVNVKAHTSFETKMISFLKTSCSVKHKCKLKNAKQLS